MKHYFVVSLVRGGILGGDLTADDQQLCYHTGKLTVPGDVRRMPMPYQDIAAADAGWLFVLPIVTLTMKGGQTHRLMVFRRRKLLRIIAEKNPACSIPTKWA